MARFQDDDEEEEKPVERKRRRPKKTPVPDDDDDGPSKRGGGDEDEEEDSLSTGNVFLDIVLDFRDDCADWAKDHLGAAIGIGVTAFLLFVVLAGLTVRYIINYVNRPTLELALTAYDYGSYAESRRYAEEVLKYAAADDARTRAGANFVLGAVTCAIAEIAWDSDRQPYYLAAASYLRHSAEYDFVPERRAEGFFLLGKSLYLSGELVPCREPLQRALELKYPEEKNITWFLANSYFLDSQPNYAEALRWLRQFRKTRTVSEEERYEADLLQTMILLRTGDVPAAEQVFLRVPIFHRFETMRHFISGQISFLKARENRQKAVELETRRDPISLGEIPVAPLPVKEEPVAVPDVPSEPEPKETPIQDPFENPETEKLLPSRPEGSVWPVFPVTPKDFESPPNRDSGTGVTPPIPAEETEETEEKLPMHKRLSSLRNTSNGVKLAVSGSRPISERSGRRQPTEPRQKTLSAVRSSSTTTQPLGDRLPTFGVPTEKSNHSTAYAQAAPVPPETRTVDPDAVIVLPSDSMPEAPVPAEFPKESFQKPAPVNPVHEAANRFRQTAKTFYEEAISHFREVRRRETFVPRWTREATLLEGIAHEEIGDHAKAQEIWQSLAATYPQSSEAAAAHYLWAEVERKFGRTETALRGYEKAFEALRENPNFACHWLSKDEMVARCDAMVREAIVLKEHRLALTMLHLMRGVMPEGEAARLRGEAYEDWANELRTQSNGTIGVRGDEFFKESNEKYRRSAEAYEALARAEYDSEDYDDWLWRAAENYRLGRDFRRAIPAYRNFLRNNHREHRPEVFLYLGEMYVHLDGIDEAASVLETAIEEYPNHALVPRMRYVLSRVYYEQKNWDKAREMLQLNLVGEYAPMSSIYRDSLYALAGLYSERQNWEEAISCYESALKLHPNAVQAAEAHYGLARCYLRRSEEMAKTSGEAPLEGVRQKIRHDALAEMEKALVHIQKSEELLVKRQQAIGLTESEKLMLRNTLFGAGSILMQLKLYDRAVPTLNVAATRYQDRPEAMDALLNLAVAFRHLGKRDDALATLNRAEVVLRQQEKSGTIPAESDWASLIEVQKNIVNMSEIHGP